MLKKAEQWDFLLDLIESQIAFMFELNWFDDVCKQDSNYVFEFLLVEWG